MSSPRQPSDSAALAGAGPAPAAPSDQQSTYSPTWLTLRERVDTDARAVDLVEPLRAALAGRTPSTIVDLGCGTGSMGRWLAGRLPGPQHWVLCDRDADLLAHARAGMPTSAADGTPVSAATRCVDLTELTAADLADAHLVTASALLDLLTTAEVERLATACVTAGCPALLTLSVTGRVELHPGDPLDGDLTEAFNAHQRRGIDGRRLLGPDAADAAVEAFARLGAAVRVRAADWRLGAPHDELTRRWLDGWLAAAGEQRPDLSGPIGVYRQRRMDQLAAGELRVTVGHRDLLALPDEPSVTGARSALSRHTEEAVCAGPSRPLPRTPASPPATPDPTSGSRHPTLGSGSRPNAGPHPREA